MKSEALEPAEYYQILAQADLVLIPYSAERYRYRSSGILVEAMAAGKVIVVGAGSWMATQVTTSHAVLFDKPSNIGGAIAEAIDRFDELSAAAQEGCEAVLAQATGTSLVRHLLASAPAEKGRRPAKRHRLLLVMNGEAMVLRNGASRVAQAQLRYLVAAGFDVVGLFLTYRQAAEHSDTAASWRTRLTEAIASFQFERVFVAGPGDHGLAPDALQAIRDERNRPGSPLRAEFDFAATFEFGGALLQFLRTHPIDAVLLNYITNFPLLDALGLDRVPVICEMHDVQSLQRAIYGIREVDSDDLDEEFRWLARCRSLISLSARETAIVRERLPDAKIETTGVYLPDPPSSLRLLAGVTELAEIVDRAGLHLPDDDADTATRLAEIGFVDLLFVSSNHLANASGLRWFFDKVYLPHLATHQVSMVIAGSICDIAGWPDLPRLFFVGQVEDLAPLYAAARVVVLPIIEGAGSPIKTFEALAYGRPVIGTTHAFRGLEGEVGDLIVRDDAEEFAAAVLALVDSAQARDEAAVRSQQLTDWHNDPAAYFRIMDRVFADVLRTGATPAPEPMDRDRLYVEWSPILQALNRVARSYLEGASLERWALHLLARNLGPALDRMIDGVCRSLVEDRDAAVLQTAPLLARCAAQQSGPRARKDMAFALRLALAGRSDPIPLSESSDGIMRAVACGGLPLQIATVGAQWVVVDGKRLNSRRVPRAATVDKSPIFEAELAASSSGGLRVADLAVSSLPSKGAATAGTMVLRQSVPISAGAALFGQNVFNGAFVLHGDGAAILPPHASGTVALPRIADGRSGGCIDLLFTGCDPDAADAPVSLQFDDQPAAAELHRVGPFTLARVLIDRAADCGNFGIMPLRVTNETPGAVCLIAAHSSLLLGRSAEAAQIATALATAEQPADPVKSQRLAELAQAAIVTILRGQPLTAPGLGVLATLATGTGRSLLRPLIEQMLQREAARNGEARGVPPSVDAVLDDIAAILDAGYGTCGERIAVLSPALPLEMVDPAGQPLPGETAALLRHRAGSWRVPLPIAETGGRARLRLDASLHLAGHPEVVRATGFHPAESPNSWFRWTGPEAKSTITLPLALTGPTLLVIELTRTGENSQASDFTMLCNGVAIPHSFAVAGENTTLTGHLPAHPSPGPLTTVELIVNHRFTPPLPDRRVLGVVFRSMSFFLFDASDAAGVGHAPPAMDKSRDIRTRQPGWPDADRQQAAD